MRLERHDITKDLNNWKHKEGTFVCTYVNNVKTCIDSLVRMSGEFPKEFSMDLVLIWFPESYKSFVANFHLKNHKVTLLELSILLEDEEAKIIEIETMAHSKVVECGNDLDKRWFLLLKKMKD